MTYGDVDGDQRQFGTAKNDYFGTLLGEVADRRRSPPTLNSWPDFWNELQFMLRHLWQKRRCFAFHPGFMAGQVIGRK
ncbi:MAG: hypothetical protein CRU78_18815, partial [Candidatus Accumulibacter phosphatis]|nr:hypothetical protein [Candidatus Accumulibacter phosphatis]